MSGPVLVELKGADIRRDGSHAALICGVNWRLAAGDFWAVAGDSGSGKSSLLETAAGLTVADAGSVEILGHDVAAAHEADHLAWRRQIGFVFEHGGRLLSQLTVADNIALPLLYHDEADEETASKRVKALLDEAGLVGIEQMLPSRLSLVTQQRVGYLRAVVQPKLVVFVDHPIGRRWWPRMLVQLRTKRMDTGASGLNAHVGRTERNGGSHSAPGSGTVSPVPSLGSGTVSPVPSGLNGGHALPPVTVALTCPDFRGWIDVATHFAIIRDGTFREIGGREQLLASNDKSVTQFT